MCPKEMTAHGWSQETPVFPHSLQPHSGARTQTKPKGPVRAGCIRKTRGMGAMGGGSDFQKKEGLPFKTAWMKPEDTVLNENSQHGKQTLQELTLCEISEKPNSRIQRMAGPRSWGERGMAGAGGEGQRGPAGAGEVLARGYRISVQQK